MCNWPAGVVVCVVGGGLESAGGGVESTSATADGTMVATAAITGRTIDPTMDTATTTPRITTVGTERLGITITATTDKNDARIPKSELSSVSWNCR